jgi:hypothetical protein
LPEQAVENAVESPSKLRSKPAGIPAKQPAKAAEKAETASTRPPKPKHFPKPPHFKCPPEKFFPYLRNLPQECQDRSIVYVYATWPVLNHVQVLPPEEQEAILKKRKPFPQTNIAKLSQPFDTDDWEMEILHRWGSGNYHFKLNDIGVPKNAEFPNKHIAMCDVRRLEDPQYPPVRDMRLIDVSHPDNASYIAQMRLKGVKFWGDDAQSEIQKEDEEMAQVAAIDTLTAALVESTKRERTEAKAAPAAPPDVQGLAGAKAVESVAEGARQGMSIISEAVKTANDMQAKAQDPKKYIEDLQAVAQMMQPKNGGGDDSPMRDMVKMMHESHIASMDAINKRLESAETWNRQLLEKIMTKPAEPASSTIDKPKSFIHQIKELAEVKDVLRDLLGGESDDTPWYAAVGLRALDTIAANATNFMHNLAVARSGMGEPVAPPEGEAEATDQPGPARPAQPAGKDAIIFTVLTNLRPPLLEALSTGVPGFDFAAWLITQNGDDRLYNLMAAEGKQGLFNLMQKHPQLWMETRAHAVRLDSFADEFLDKEKVAAAIQLARASNTVIPHVTPTSQPPASGPKPNGPVRPIIGADGKPIEHRAPQVNRGATAGE